jgi:hypothetical protein
VARSPKKKAAPAKKSGKPAFGGRGSETEQKAVQKTRRSPFRGASDTERKAAAPAPKGRRAAPKAVKKTVEKTAKSVAVPKPHKKAVKKPTKTEKLVAEIKKLKGQKKRLEAKRKKDRERYEQTKADLAKTKAGAKRLQAQEERKKERKKKREEKAPAAAEIRTHKAKIGKTTHVSATEVDGEPQYIWKELEEKTEDKLVRTKKGKKRRWARLVVELSKESLLFPENYRRLRGKAVIRTSWHPAHELIGKAARVMDSLQQSGAMVPRAKIVIVESNKKPPRRVF